MEYSKAQNRLNGVTNDPHTSKCPLLCVHFPERETEVCPKVLKEPSIFKGGCYSAEPTQEVPRHNQNTSVVMKTRALIRSGGYKTEGKNKTENPKHTRHTIFLLGRRQSSRFEHLRRLFFPPISASPASPQYNFGVFQALIILATPPVR